MEWCRRKGTGQSCRFQHLLATSFKVPSLSRNVSNCSCWCPHKEGPPVLTSLLPLSDYHCLHTPSLVVCWQNPFSRLWALSLSGEQAMTGPCKTADLCRTRSAQNRQTEAQLFILSSFFQGDPNLTSIYSPSQRNTGYPGDWLAVIGLSFKLNVPYLT